MNTLLKISWRNVWRNTGRSIVIILAVAFGLWGGIFATAFSMGMIEQMFNTSIEKNISHIQIHHPDYLNDKLLKYHLQDINKMESFFKKNETIKAYTKRTIVNGMLATASMSKGIDIYGIDPVLENNTTQLAENIIDGQYFDEHLKNQIIIGKALADKMKINTGARIVITFQDINSDMVSAAFRVCGIYKTSNSGLDELKAFVLLKDLELLLNKENVITEIALLAHNLEQVSALKTSLEETFPQYIIRSWSQIAPELSFMNEMSGTSLMVLIVIILFALAFGLLNTMLMTVFERTRELGVLMAVGMNKIRIFSMIVLETMIITFSGALLGSILSIITISFTHTRGLDLSAFGAESLSDFGVDAIVYPNITSDFFIYLAIMVFLTAVLAAVYPAYKALKLKPAEAVRKE